MVFASELGQSKQICGINVKVLVSFKNLNTLAMPVKPKEKSFVPDTKECKQSSRD